ncbi:hypothetical protein [Psychrobacillus sp. OK032]|nr:hypothetical protein [Psychrobacillus sp. OK032]
MSDQRRRLVIYITGYCGAKNKYKKGTGSFFSLFLLLFVERIQHLTYVH